MEVFVIDEIRPDVVHEWDDFEVARRWLTLCPERQPRADKGGATPHRFAPLSELPGGVHGGVESVGAELWSPVQRRGRSAYER